MAEQYLLKVKKRIIEASEAITLILEPLDRSLLQYTPGQFLTFIFHVNEKEIRRSYSLSSSPGIDEHLAITFKRIPNGEISTYLFYHIKEGDFLSAIPPAGRFVYQADNDTNRDIFLIAAGTGISPVYSILKAALQQEPNSHITLLYSNRNEHSTIFFNELGTLEKEHKDRFTCIHILSNPENKDRHYRAHLNIGLLEDLVIQNTQFRRENTLFYLCGPFAYMRMARMTLIAMGYEDAQIRKENFVVKEPANEMDRFPIHDLSQKEITISYKGSTHQYTAAYDKTLLKTGLEHGLSLPYSCLGGVCGTCTAKCTEGKVWMSINEVLTDKDIKQGLVLTCTGYALTKQVKVEF